MKMGSIFNHHFTTILTPHSYSLSQSNHFYSQFTKPPICNLLLLSSNQLSNRIYQIVHAKKKNNPSSEIVLSPSIVDEVSQNDEFLDEFDDDDGIFLFIYHFAIA